MMGLGLVGRSIFFRDHVEKKWGVPQETAHMQAGFEGSKIANTNVRVERFQGEDPPTELGRVAVENNGWIARNNDISAIPINIKERGRGRAPAWNPLWADPRVQQESRKLEYDWVFLTPSNAREDVMLYRRNLVHAPRQQPFLVPTFKPEPKKLFKSHQVYY